MNEERSSLIQTLERSPIELTLAYDATIEGFGRALGPYTRSPGHAFGRIANLMGNAKQVRDATIATAENIDFIIPIRVIHEVRRESEIARVEKELRDGPGARPSSASMRLLPWMHRAGNAWARPGLVGSKR